MAKKERDDAEEWGEAIEDASGAELGMSKETLRKALALNPALREQGSTADFLKTLEKRTELPESKSEPRATNAMDLAAALSELKDKTLKETKRLDAEIAVLQKERATVHPKALARVLDLMLAIDPNLTSPMTQELMRREKTFLDSVGFTVGKLLDKKAGKRVG